MAIGILYESKEWSSFALRDYINEMGVSATLIDMQEDISAKGLLSYELIVNRVFASSVFRGHQKALDQMPAALDLLQKHGVPILNPAEAHYYEISKTRAKGALAAHAFPVPKLLSDHSIKFPCVLKPDCGGRTSYTFIVQSFEELCEKRRESGDIRFITEEYIRPDLGYVTRIEVIGKECRLALKRSVTENGLSAYHLGSEYEVYGDLPEEIRDTAVRAMDCLKIEAGSMDIIENKTGYYIIDVNSVSNASFDNTEMFGFDLMKETAAYAVRRTKLSNSRFDI